MTPVCGHDHRLHHAGAGIGAAVGYTQQPFSGANTVSIKQRSKNK